MRLLSVAQKLPLVPPLRSYSACCDPGQHSSDYVFLLHLYLMVHCIREGSYFSLIPAHQKMKATSLRYVSLGVVPRYTSGDGVADKVRNYH